MEAKLKEEEGRRRSRSGVSGSVLFIYLFIRDGILFIFLIGDFGSVTFVG